MEKEMLSVEVIQAAVAGEKVAVQKVVEYYADYIDELCTVDKTLEDGTTKKVVDEDMRQSVILKLIESLPDFKIED